MRATDPSYVANWLTTIGGLEVTIIQISNCFYYGSLISRAFFKLGSRLRWKNHGRDRDTIPDPPGPVPPQLQLHLDHRCAGQQSCRAQVCPIRLNISIIDQVFTLM